LEVWRIGVLHHRFECRGFAPRNPQDVQRRRLSETRLRLEIHAVNGRHTAAVLRDQNRLQRVGFLVCPIEHLEGASDIEQIDAFVNGYSQPHGETSLIGRLGASGVRAGVAAMRGALPVQRARVL
jgi:hypothetical protein